MRKVLYLIVLLSCTMAFGQKDKKITEKTVSKASIQAHLKFMSSDALKGRDTPSPELDIAAEYLRTQLELYGVKPFAEFPDYFQPVSMKKIKKPQTGTITLDSATYTIGVDYLLISGGNLEWNGEIAFLDYATTEELEKADVKGKIVVANTGDGEEQSPRAWFAMSREKRANAKEAGALGLIELYNSPQIPWQLLVNYLSRDQVILDDGIEDERDEFAGIWLNNANREASPSFANTSKLDIKMAGAGVERFVSQNVVGYVEGTDPVLKKDYVTFSAHYDHVGVGRADSTGDDIYNGTRDNAVGTVTVLEAAKNLATYPTKRSSLFVMFCGEEKGLLGSQWFVDHSPLPLSDIVFCFNSDNGGYNNTSMATVIGLDRTTAQGLLVTAIESYGLTAGDDANYKEQGLFDRSDNVSFAKKGIPAPSFGMGVDAFDEQVLRTYHQPSDEFDTIDMDYLYTFYRAYVFAGRSIGNMKETPFWVEGDKYYEVGKELYK